MSNSIEKKKNLKFPFFNEEEKQLLHSSINVVKDKYSTWNLWNFLLPFIIFIAPMLFVYFDSNDIPKVIAISVNGNLPLIPVMILISLLSIDLPLKSNNQTVIDSIKRKTRTFGIITGVIAFIIYITETIDDRSNKYWLFLLISIITLFISNYISKIYYLIQRSSISAVAKNQSRAIKSETELAKSATK